MATGARDHVVCKIALFIIVPTMSQAHTVTGTRDPRRAGRKTRIVLGHRVHLGYGKAAGDGGHDAI